MKFIFDVIIDRNSEVIYMLKEDVKKVIDNMPNDCTLEDIQYS